MQRNKAHKRRENHKRATSSSTACAVPLPRWGRHKRPINQNLNLSFELRDGFFEKLTNWELLGASGFAGTALDARACLAALRGVLVVKVISTPKIEPCVVVHT